MAKNGISVNTKILCNWFFCFVLFTQHPLRMASTVSIYFLEISSWVPSLMTYEGCSWIAYGCIAWDQLQLLVLGVVTMHHKTTEASHFTAGDSPHFLWHILAFPSFTHSTAYHQLPTLTGKALSRCQGHSSAGQMAFANSQSSYSEDDGNSSQVSYTQSLCDGNTYCGRIKKCRWVGNAILWPAEEDILREGDRRGVIPEG